jgi:hypothetical protein
LTDFGFFRPTGGIRASSEFNRVRETAALIIWVASYFTHIRRVFVFRFPAISVMRMDGHQIGFDTVNMYPSDVSKLLSARSGADVMVMDQIGNLMQQAAGLGSAGAIARQRGDEAAS